MKSDISDVRSHDRRQIVVGRVFHLRDAGRVIGDDRLEHVADIAGIREVLTF